MNIQGSGRNETESSRVQGKILAIDFGKSKIGLAMADNETKIAFAYGILENNERLIDELVKITKKENVEKVVIGTLEHKFSQREEVLEEFVQKLKKQIQAEIFFQEEMFTSRMAGERMKEAGKKNVSQDDDQAAKIILEDWIEKHL